MLGLEDKQRRTHGADRIYQLDRGYLISPTWYLSVTLVANISQSSRSLAYNLYKTRC